MDLLYKIEKGIYLISPPTIDDLELFASDLKFILKRVKISCFQLRLKDVSLEVVKKTINLLKPICIKTNVLFILNDDYITAAQYACDGVHLGKLDGDLHEAMRKFQGIIGVSCYSDVQKAIKFAEGGASYVSFGAFYETETKPDATPCEVSVITEFRKKKKDFPVCVIGGINSENAKPLIEKGAHLVAVCSAVWNLKKNTEKVLELEKILNYFN
jgi:thiamine-phosphate pyrophosphorylase